MTDPSESGNIPVPDPTLLTTAQLFREIANVHAIIQGKIDSNTRIIELLQQTDRDRQPSIDRAIACLKELHETMMASHEDRDKLAFAAINLRFDERDKRFDQLDNDNKTAIGAALQAQKEAASIASESTKIAFDKLENSFTKQIEQLQDLLRQVDKGSDDKIGEIKSRLDRGEGKTSVLDPATSAGLERLGKLLADLTRSQDTSHGAAVNTASMVSYAIGIGGVAVAVLAVFYRH